MIDFFGNMASSGSPRGKAPAGTKVIIVAGQSNAGGEQYNEPAFQNLPIEMQGDLTGFNRIFKYDNVINHDEFAVVNDTVSNRIGADLSLGYYYQKYHNEDIYFIKYAYGAAALSQNANPNFNIATSSPNSLFIGLKDCITTAMGKLEALGLNPTIRGFVWYQGEEDGYQGQTKTAYKQNEQDFFNGLKADLGLETLKIYCALPRDKNGGNNFSLIRAAKLENELEYPDYKTIDTLHLQFDSFYFGVHLTKAGQIELGRKIFELLKNN